MQRSRADLPLTILLSALTIGIAAYCAPRGFHFGFTDMGHDGYQLRQVLDISRGAVIFRDTFDQYGPLNAYINALGFIAFGGRLLAIKWVMCGWYGLTAALLYTLGRRWLTPALAAFSVLIWLGLAPFYQHGIMISPHAAILSLQAFVMLLLVSPPDVREHTRSRLALVGVATGLCWAMKESYGVLFLCGLFAFFVSLGISRRLPWRRVFRASTLIAGGFASVVAIALGSLWFAGALHDWYLQTIVFPQGLYLAGGSPAGMMATLASFARLQATASAYWFVIRGVVIAAGVVALFRREMPAEALLFASVTAALWLGAYPSANFMHQWWTASLSILAFVIIVWQVTAWPVRLAASRGMVTVLVVVLVVGFGLTERVFTARERSRRLNDVIEAPEILRGVRTPAPTKRIFSAIYQEMIAYRRKHPGARVVSIEAASEPASLPFVSFLPDNPHSGPVYWTEPVLATVTYPRYLAELTADIERARPLLVDHTLMEFAPKTIPHYALRLAAPSDYGYWYVYEPVDDVTEAVFLNSNGQPAVLSASAATRTETVEQPNNWNVYGARAAQPAGSAALYAFPGTLAADRVPSLDRVVPLADAPTLRVAAVTEIAPGAWTIDGHITDRFAYALKFPIVERPKGAMFVASGEVQSGGVTVGVTQHEQWYAVVNVTKPGPFVVVLEMPSAGRYELTVANCVESSWQNALSLVTNVFLRNHVRVTRAGWVR